MQNLLGIVLSIDSICMLKSVALTFRTRMAGTFGLLFLLVGLPAYFYISSFQREQLIADRRINLETLATSAATVIAENLNERRREIELLSKTPLFRDEPLDSPEFGSSLERLKNSYPYYSWIGLTDNAGMVRAATSGHLLGQSVAQRPWYIHGKADVFVGDVHEALLLSKLLPSEGPDPIRFIDFAAPVIDANGQLRGVLASHAHWRWAGEVLEVVKPSNANSLGLDIFIIDSRNQIIYPERMPGKITPPTEADVLGAGSDGFLNWGETASYLTASASIKDPVSSVPLGWKIVVRQPEATVVADVRRIQRSVLVSSGLAGVIFLVMIWLGANRISRPLGSLTDDARRIARGERNVVFEVDQGALELRQLSSALQSMYEMLLQQKDSLERSNQELEAKVAERTEELERSNRELEGLARTDALTGLSNRLEVEERLASEFARFQRSREPYSILVMDVDFFKSVNDTFGHAAGDKVLQQLGEIIRQNVREVDVVGRVGGEEFLVLLPMTRLPQALLVAEKIRHAVSVASIEPVGRITISIGVQEAGPDDSSKESAVKLADQWMYHAKKAGRNRIAPAALEQPVA